MPILDIDWINYGRGLATLPENSHLLREYQGAIDRRC